MRRLLKILFLGLALSSAHPQSALADPAEWPLALELMASGQVQAALPFLERLVSADPANKNYRFELALALFQLKRDFRAKWHLEQVRGASLTAPEARLVEQVLAQIAARSVWTASFSLSLKPESNASRKTSVDTVSVGGLDFTLSPESRAKPAVSVLVAAGLGYSPRLSEHWRARFSLNANLRHNKDSSLRDYQLTARAGLQYSGDERCNFAAGLQQGYRWVSNRRYSGSTGIWGEHTRLVGARGQLTLGFDFSKIRHEVALPDSNRALASVSYGHAVSGKARVTVSGYLEKTRGNLPSLAGTRSGIFVSGIYAWNGGLVTSLQLGQQYDERRGPEPLFGVTRGDETTSLSMTIYHRDFRIQSFSPTLVIGVEKNRSNIPLARYDNRYMSLGLTRSF